MRYFTITAMVLMLGCLPLSLFAQQGDVDTTVEAEGSAAVINKDIGRAEDEALTDAKKNAVEQGIGVFVKADVLGKNFQVVEKTILTKSEGYISSWEKIEGSRKIENVEGNQLLTIKIKAKVKLASLVNALSDIEAIYDGMNRPRIMVLISEQNVGQKPEGLPVSASAIMRTLGDRKFDVVDPEVIERLIAKESTRAVIERGDAQAAALLAMQEGAEILVLGSAKASQQTLPEDAGDVVKAASALLNARIVYADTGGVLFTAKQTDGRGVSTSNVEDAGMKALNDAGNKLISDDSARFAGQVIARWAKEIQNGRSFKVTADNVTFSELSALKKVIREFRGHVDFVGESKYVGRTGTITVKSKLTPEQFRERLSESTVDGKQIEISSVSGATTALILKAPKGVKIVKPSKGK